MRTVRTEATQFARSAGSDVALSPYLSVWSDPDNPGRGELYVLCEVTGPSGRRLATAKLVQAALGETYFRVGALGVRAALRHAVDAAHRRLLAENLRQSNLHFAKAGLSMLAVAGSRAWLAQVQPAQVFLTRGGVYEAYPRPLTWASGGTPLDPLAHQVSVGAKEPVVPGVTSWQLNPGDAILLCCTRLGRVLGDEEAAAEIASAESGQLLSHLQQVCLARGLANAQAMLVTVHSAAAAGTAPDQPLVAGASSWVRSRFAAIRGSGGPIPKPLSEDNDAAEPDPAAAASSYEPHEHASPPVTRGPRPVGAYDVDMALDRSPLGRGDFPELRLPAAESRRGPSLLLLALVAAVVVLVAVAGSLRLTTESERAATRVAAIDELSAARERALAAGSPAEVRSRLEDLSLQLRGARGAGLDPGRLGQLEEQVQADRDRLDRVTRLQRPRLLADLGQQGPGATADTLLIRDRDLFILDRGRQALHLLTEGSDLTTVLKKGDEVDGRTVADLVALVWGQDGPLILDRDRGLFVRGPDGVWSSSELGPGGTDQPPRAMASYDGNLYLLRDQVPAILRYDKGAYDGPGRPWLDPEAENGTIRPVSLAVDGRIYLLSADGQVQRLLRGKQETSPFLVDVVPEVADPVLIFTSPEHKNLYLLDGRSRVIEVTKDGQFLRQFRAPMGFPDQRWTAFLVDDQVTRLYLGADGKVWVTEIPPVTQPRKTDG